jgi:hypothetical protein
MNAARQLIVDLANLPSTREAVQAFQEKHELEMPDERVLAFQDVAQSVWSGGSERSIERLREVLLPPESIGAIGIDWKARSLSYQPITNIQAGFYYLLQNSNLAKRCGNECVQRFFFAKRPNERYCSARCFAAAQKAAKKDWWQEHAEEFRERRSK